MPDWWRHAEEVHAGVIRWGGEAEDAVAAGLRRRRCVRGALEGRGVLQISSGAEVGGRVTVLEQVVAVSAVTYCVSCCCLSLGAGHGAGESAIRGWGGVICQIVVSRVCRLRAWTAGVCSNGGAGVMVAAVGGRVRCRANE